MRAMLIAIAMHVGIAMRHRSPFSNERPKAKTRFCLSTAMTIFLLYPTFYIEFTIPCHDVYLLYVYSIRLQIKSLGEGMAAVVARAAAAGENLILLYYSDNKSKSDGNST